MENKITFNFKTTQSIINRLNEIEKFSSKWEIIERKENRYLKHLKEIETIKSVGSSTRIEGVTMTNEEIETLLKNIKITEMKTRDEQEVVGYYEALETILNGYIDIPLSESNIRSLHNILLQHSTKDYRHRGNYKNLPNKVVATYPGGHTKIIFNTPEPFLTGKEMYDLIKWTNEELEKKEINPLLVIGTFTYEFLSIHPFQDGNGRLSRLLTTLLLLRTNYDFVQYISMENIIEERKKDYYKALMDGQKNRYTAEEKIDSWLNFFLDIIIQLTKRLEVKYSTIAQKSPPLNSRQEQILTFIKIHQEVDLKQILAAHSDFSRNTLKKDMTYLVQNFVINKIGKGRNTTYELKEEYSR